MRSIPGGVGISKSLERYGTKLHLAKNPPLMSAATFAALVIQSTFVAEITEMKGFFTSNRVFVKFRLYSSGQS